MATLTTFNVHHAFQSTNDKGTILHCRGGIFNYYAPKTVRAIKFFVAADYPMSDNQRKLYTQNKDTIVMDNLSKDVLDEIVNTDQRMREHQGSAQIGLERERLKFKKIAFVTERWSD
jgi:hypothetical protein